MRSMSHSKKAIIIGATSGIGKELAKVLAKNDYVVGIAGRRINLLYRLQKEINVNTYIKQIDVAKANDAIKQINELINEMKGVDLIIISSGVFFNNHDLVWEKEKSTIDVNVSGFAAMVNVAFNYFLKRKSGHIVGISSIKAHRGGSEAPAYNASKAFVSNYLEGLRKKAFLKCSDLLVTTIEPGFVDTLMYKDGEKSNILVATKEKAADQIFKAISKKRDHAYITRRWIVIAWIYKNIPSWLYKRF